MLEQLKKAMITKRSLIETDMIHKAVTQWTSCHVVHKKKEITRRRRLLNTTFASLYRPMAYQTAVVCSATYSQ